MNYLLAIQRSFRQNWNYQINKFIRPVFNFSGEGLISVLDNKVREPQDAGVVPQTHNVIGSDEVKRL